MKWEYLIRTSELESVDLNELGEASWELVAVTIIRTDMDYSFSIFYFKRPVKESE